MLMKQVIDKGLISKRNLGTVGTDENSILACESHRLTTFN
jgi:hypothetical protein